jgi:hypothetical protein
MRRAPIWMQGKTSERRRPKQNEFPTVGETGRQHDNSHPAKCQILAAADPYYLRV